MIGLPSFFKAEWYSTICTYHIALSICLLIDTWVTSTSWLLWIMLQWPWVCKYPFQILFSIILGIYQEVGKCCFSDMPDFYQQGKMSSYCHFGNGLVSVHSWVIDLVALMTWDAGKQRAKQETSKEKYPPRNSFFLLTSSKGPLTLTALRCGENFPLK